MTRNAPPGVQPVLFDLPPTAPPPGHVCAMPRTHVPGHVPALMPAAVITTPVVLCDVVEAGRDAAGQPLYKLVPRTNERRAELTPELAYHLGFTAGYPTTNTLPVRRLIRAGFVLGERVTPSRYLIDLGDWFNRYLKDVEDPHYWDDEKRREQLRAAYDEEN